MSDDFEVVTIAERCAKEKRVAELEAYCQAMRKVGTLMSNVLYNYAQKEGKVLVKGDCQLLKKYQKQWDEIIRESVTHE